MLRETGSEMLICLPRYATGILVWVGYLTDGEGLNTDERVTVVGNREDLLPRLAFVVLTAYISSGLTTLLGSGGSTGRIESHIKPTYTPYIHIHQYTVAVREPSSMGWERQPFCSSSLPCALHGPGYLVSSLVNIGGSLGVEDPLSTGDYSGLF
jgi:hypothetical protein